MKPERKPKVQVALIDEPARGLGWHGGGVTVDPGAYLVANLDSIDPDLVMLKKNDGALLALIERQSVAEFREVLDTPHATEWAAYYRSNPDTLAVWGEQNGRKP